MNPFRRGAHLPDATLLLLLEGDLHGRALRRAERHLAACAGCSQRRLTLQRTSQQVEQFELQSGLPAYEENAPLLQSGAARERLAAMLALQAKTTGQGWRGQLRRLVSAPVLSRAAAVVALLLAALAWRLLDPPMQDRMAVVEQTGPEPDHILTPGSVDPVSLAEVCGLSDENLDPPLSAEKQRAVFRAYGINEHAARAYQVDYLINPQLGGNDHMQNLWPEPYHATVWNARAKDALEARLHGMVCNREVSLGDAQQELSTDWIAAYKKHFHTQRPVSTVAGLDRADAATHSLP